MSTFASVSVRASFAFGTVRPDTGGEDIDKPPRTRSSARRTLSRILAE